MNFLDLTGPSIAKGRLSQILTSAQHFVFSVSAPLCRSQMYLEDADKEPRVAFFSISAGREV